MRAPDFGLSVISDCPYIGINRDPPVFISIPQMCLRNYMHLSLPNLTLHCSGSASVLMPVTGRPGQFLTAVRVCGRSVWMDSTSGTDNALSPVVMRAGSRTHCPVVPCCLCTESIGAGIQGRIHTLDSCSFSWRQWCKIMGVVPDCQKYSRCSALPVLLRYLHTGTSRLIWKKKSQVIFFS